MSRLLTLQLGVGDVVEPDYDLRVDIRTGLPGANLVADARKLGLPSSSVALIKASHLIEHFAESEQPGVLAEWRRVLIPGGILLLWTPDREWFERSRREGKIDQDEYEITLGIGGRRRYAYAQSQHLCVWDERMARHILDRAGFGVIDCKTDAGGSLCIVAEAL
jgi:ubiquinone/menaquinone biosynthesis C-methylase UbiE